MLYVNYVGHFLIVDSQQNELGVTSCGICLLFFIFGTIVKWLDSIMLSIFHLDTLMKPLLTIFLLANYCEIALLLNLISHPHPLH